MTLSPGRGLDAFNALVASVQTGFGPFVAVYLASEAWTQREIGVALSLGTAAALLSQVPAGALVDRMRSKRRAAVLACLAVAASAALLALSADRASVWLAELLHGFASCMLTPAIAAISLGLAGREGLGERLGRNARYAALGSGVAAAVMGVVGNWDEVAVFWLTALLMGPALLALTPVGRGAAAAAEPAAPTPLAGLLRDRRLILFAAALGLFSLGNAAALPLVGAELTRQIGSRASLVIAACIVVPQLLVALISPSVGRAAERLGRRPLLVLALAALPVRLSLLAWVESPVLVVAVQALDGISAAGIGVLLPLVAADVTRGTGRFNLCMGVLGLAISVGATLSTALAGFAADRYGYGAALMGLAAAGLAGALLVTRLRDTRAGAEGVR